MFADKARAYLSQPPFRYSTNRAGSWPYTQTLDEAGKNLPGTNPLAYCGEITEVKSFIFGPDCSPDSSHRWVLHLLHRDLRSLRHHEGGRMLGEHYVYLETGMSGWC